MKCPACAKDTGVTIRLEELHVCEDCFADARPEEVSHLCRECDKRVLNGSGSEAKLLAAGLCFSCNHWTELVGAGGIVVDFGSHRRHYMAGDEPLPGESRRFLGHGGTRMEIQFLDGRQLVSHNLWHQGHIPPHFEGRFPVNAKFGFDAKQEVA